MLQYLQRQSIYFLSKFAKPMRNHPLYTTKPSGRLYPYLLLHIHSRR
jgi:hypothetical protein